MPNRIKLCAIAKNEGAYLADWVFHHLHFGFDEIEIWVNGTADTSVDIMESICSKYPQVGFRVADKLARNSLAKGKSFQYRAYERLAKRAAQDGASHVAFLDLDEYWTPRDFTAGIGTFIPDDQQINVVSFQWCLDTPDPGREPFGSLFSGSPKLQLDPHVKSVVRLDQRIVQFRTHTARTTSGVRLVVRDPFPLVDEREQQWGSLLPFDYVVQHSDVLPEAFVLHAVHRSQVEYIASLAKGLRQTGADLEFKTNRQGYAPSDAPQLEFSPSAEALTSYARERNRFHSNIQADPLVRESERLTVERARAVLATAVEDADVMGQLRGPLRQVSASVLDSRYPGWDARVEWYVDGLELDQGRLCIAGWAYGAGDEHIEFALRDDSGAEWWHLSHTPVARPDVVLAHPAAPLECGFRIEVPAAARDHLEGAVLMARLSGSQFWERERLNEALARVRGLEPGADEPPTRSREDRAAREAPSAWSVRET